MYSRAYVEITNICNMHCSFCHGHTRPPRQMTEAEFVRVLDQLQGVTGYLYYHLMGEPLTHPLLPRFLSLARERGFHSQITTNGTLLARFGDAILRAGVHKVNLSLHSFEKGDDAAFLHYLSVVTDFASAAADQGVIVVLRLWNKGCDDGRNGVVMQFLTEHLQGEWAENTRGYRVRDKLFLEWGERFVWPDKDAPALGDAVFCYGLGDHFGILSDGTVVPCCLDSDGAIPLGNIYHEPLTEILNAPRAQAMRNGFACHHATEELCKRCGYARRFKI